GEWQPGVRNRAPERPPPSAVLCPVDGLGIGELGKNPCRCFGDYMVAFAHDRCFCRFPARIWLPPFALGHGGAKHQPWQGHARLIGKNTPDSVTAKQSRRRRHRRSVSTLQEDYR